ncbi:DUF1624 domain-containing protein [Chitinophaga rhizophila]|uniref:Heparan-alpha-glucosaminide N-acetyltransferase domain-containing protein n=1 Tax=Chitinophaga rhizophila TaxID=2866212 RepID=A0ABS7GJK1_9BACT|nr:heparan-alpha-glucosaminide N-acetyltransferase domain-containing protein [Chitinophaga rhizophila]MBW8686638.1 heparan-alpha-glucosaminide N-acetyltransferase domain-containing protein [Chitinophaga rhizophila]
MQSASSRIASIDILRGIIMIIMALDHTRDFFHNTAMTADPLDAATTTPLLFFTRWITHYCAPAFVFLSGLSAYIASQKKTMKEASTFLMKRGLWLIIAELVIVTLGLTFNPLYNVFILQVIWAIGWSMIVLGLLMRLSFKAVLFTGLLLFFGHNILDYFTLPGNIWKILFTSFGTVIPMGGNRFIFAFYAILPWTSAMLLGYCAGYFFRKDATVEVRRKFLLITGSAAILLFIVLRSINHYGNPTPWEFQQTGFRTFLDFIDVSKYPPSLDFLCMTLGPTLLALAGLEQVKGRWQEVISVYGKVPFFYYILHFYLLHFLLVIAFFLSGYTAGDIVDPNIPFLFRPVNFGYTLPIVYAIWISVVAILYKPSQWFGKYRQTHTQWWLKYI